MNIAAIDLDDFADQPPAIHALYNQARDDGHFCGDTVSGKGKRIFVFGDMEPEGRRRDGVEVYRQDRFMSLPRGTGELKPGQAIVDKVLRWIDGQPVQGGGAPEKPSQSAYATPEQLDRIERAVRATAGLACERMLEKQTSDYGDTGFSSRSEQIFYLCRLTASKGLEAGIAPDIAILTGMTREVVSRFAVVWEWIDGTGLKWERDSAGGKTVSNAVKAALAEHVSRPVNGGTARQTDEWPEPDEIRNDLPPVPAFNPDEYLPPAIAAYVRDQAELLQVPPEVIAAPLIVAMGAVIGNRLAMMPKAHDSTWLEPPNLWSVVVLPPGYKKTPAQRRALAPLQPLERQLEERHKQRLAEHEVALIKYKTARALWEKDVAKGAATAADKPVEPVEPGKPRLIVSDSTMAKLEEQLRDSLHGLLLVWDELAGWWAGLSRPDAAGDREKVLTMWDGLSPLLTSRISRGETIVPMATLSVIGGTQPSKLARVVRDAVKNDAGADGFLQRHQLAIYPDANQPYRHVDRLPDIDATEEVFAIAQRLFDLNPIAIGAKPHISLPLHYLKYTSEAQEVFDQWIVRLEQSLRSDSLHPALCSHFSKFRGLVPKLSLIFHLIEDGAGPVTLDALRLAIKWANFLVSHAKRIYAGAIRGADLATKNLADRIRAGKVPSPFKGRDIRLKGWAGLTEREDVAQAIEGLIDAGWLREERIAGTGRPTSQYFINPKIMKPAS